MSFKLRLNVTPVNFGLMFRTYLNLAKKKINKGVLLKEEWERLESFRPLPKLDYTSLPTKSAESRESKKVEVKPKLDEQKRDEIIKSVSEEVVEVKKEAPKRKVVDSEVSNIRAWVSESGESESKVLVDEPKVSANESEVDTKAEDVPVDDIERRVSRRSRYAGRFNRYHARDKELEDEIKVESKVESKVELKVEEVSSAKTVDSSDTVVSRDDISDKRAYRRQMIRRMRQERLEQEVTATEKTTEELHDTSSQITETPRERSIHSLRDRKSRYEAYMRERESRVTSRRLQENVDENKDLSGEVNIPDLISTSEVYKLNEKENWVSDEIEFIFEDFPFDADETTSSFDDLIESGVSAYDLTYYESIDSLGIGFKFDEEPETEEEDFNNSDDEVEDNFEEDDFYDDEVDLEEEGEVDFDEEDEVDLDEDEEVAFDDEEDDLDEDVAFDDEEDDLDEDVAFDDEEDDLDEEVESFEEPVQSPVVVPKPVETNPKENGTNKSRVSEKPKHEFPSDDPIPEEKKETLSNLYKNESKELIPASEKSIDVQGNESLINYVRRLNRVPEREVLYRFPPRELELALLRGQVIRKAGLVIFSHS